MTAKRIRTHAPEPHQKSHCPAAHSAHRGLGQRPAFGGSTQESPSIPTHFTMRPHLGHRASNPRGPANQLLKIIFIHGQL